MPQVFMPHFYAKLKSTIKEFGQSLIPIFTPPFDGLGIIVVLYIIWAHLVFPHNDVLRGNLPDPDDYMYLTQVLDWVKGQGWYDNIQRRLDFPTGTPIHFSRLVQLPLAAGIVFFHRLGLPLRGAATVTARQPMSYSSPLPCYSNLCPVMLIITVWLFF